ncbi:MAG: efflux RND transporter periplasmic adaptor subunit [Acidobacteria bacterium]|nr:efflux RND transporter periplasmic adaptor subunit [Acidobacteriota bacterium]
MRFIHLTKQKANFKLLLVIFAFALCLACNKSEAENAKKENANNNQGSTEAPTAITVDKAISREVPAVIQTTGSLVADETSDIAPKVAGKVVNIYANVGEFVGRGSVIAKIDDKDARLRLAEAQAGVKQAQSAVRQAEVRLGLSANGTFNSSTIPEVRAANANYEQVLAELRQAEANEKRYRDLVETGDVAMITYETYRTNRDTARARVNAAKQQLEAAVNAAKLNNQAIKGAQAAVEAAQTQVATAQQAVTDTIIRAPFSGFISERPTAVGEYVTSSTPVATILRTNPIKLQMQVAESDVPYVSIGKAVSLEVDAYKDRRFGGTVTAINPAIDPTSRSAVVEAQIENGDNALRSGMFVTARIIRQGGNIGIFVPKSAVYDDQSTQSYRVFVIQEGVAKLRVVQLGTEENDFVQILSGVNADETIATSNLKQLYEGAEVQF